MGQRSILDLPERWVSHQNRHLKQEQRYVPWQYYHHIGWQYLWQNLQRNWWRKMPSSLLQVQLLLNLRCHVPKTANHVSSSTANQKSSYLWFRFTSEGGVVNFHVWWLDNSQISWDTITAFDFNNVTKDKSSSQNSFLFATTDSKGLLGYHVFEGFHDCIGFWFLKNGSFEVKGVIWGHLPGSIGKHRW